MKALAYQKPHGLTEFSLIETEVAKPELRPLDVLVEIKAISTNPVDYKIRQSRSGTAEKPVILGWDLAGTVVAKGDQVKEFSVGDTVYGAGDITRDGAYAQFVAIDSRIIARKPKSLNFSQAAAMPLTVLTAWESLIDRKDLNLNDPQTTILVIGGAGGVGSVAIQLLKQITKAKVIATASRPETISFVREMGADHVIDHRKDMPEQIRNLGIQNVDVVFCTSYVDQYVTSIVDILRPYGHLCLISDPKVFDIAAFKSKALSVHWEMMFAKARYGYKLETQGQILKQFAELVDQGKIKSTAKTVFQGFTADNIRKAHQLLESGASIGKIAIEF